MTKKPTLATLKAFVRKNSGALYLNVKSTFDGMVDGIEYRRDGFQPTKASDHNEKHNLGINGVWLVGQSRDYISRIDENGFVGFHVYNCCGSFDLAVKSKEVPVEYFIDAFAPNVMALATLTGGEK